MISKQEVEKLRKQERKKLDDKSFKKKIVMKEWKLTNTHSFANIDDVNFLLYNNLDVTSCKAYKPYNKKNVNK